MKRSSLALLAALAALTASPAWASFHFMKIEQAMGGVGGDTTQQAIQLRMRANGQNFLNGQGRLVVRDATGSNPITLISFTADAAVGLQGRRVLIVSSAFATAQPAIHADFTMTNLIPASYMAAGRLTFESVGGTIYWSLAWGGSGYTGSHLGSTANDMDGNFGPAFGAALPSSSTQALLFTASDPTGAAFSTTNLADYSVTAGAATFTNNANQSGTVTSGTPQADVSITKADSPDPVTVLQPLTYTLAVSNLGPAGASSLVVTDPLPAGTVYQSAMGTGWTCGHATGTVTCTRASLAVGAAPDITIVVTAPATSGPITNTASVSAAQTDPVPGNNSDSEGTTVSPPPQANLSIAKSDSPDPVTVLQPLSYTLAVGNAGPNAASSLSVVDMLPAGTVYQSATGTGWTCGQATGTVTCTRPALAVGAAPDITIVVTAPATPGPIVNTASVSATETDPVPANNTDSETTTVNTAPPQADLSITNSDGGLEGRWGQRLTYTLTASNAGPAAVNAATVADTFPAGLSSVSWTCTASGGSTCPADGTGNISASVGLLVGGSATFIATGTVNVGAASPLTNTATIAAPGGTTDPNPANNSATETTPVGPIEFYAVTPCRLADTRGPAGPSGGPALQANTIRDFPVSGLCTIPADARAVAITLTVVQETEAGNLRLYPAGAPLPTASTINFRAGRVRANNAIIALGTGGRVSVRCDMAPGSAGSTQFLFDVTGYFR